MNPVSGVIFPRVILYLPRAGRVLCSTDYWTASPKSGSHFCSWSGGRGEGRGDGWEAGGGRRGKKAEEEEAGGRVGEERVGGRVGEQGWGGQRRENMRAVGIDDSGVGSSRPCCRGG